MCFFVQFKLHFEQCFKNFLKQLIKSRIYHEQIVFSQVRSNSKCFSLCIMCRTSLTKNVNTHIFLETKKLALSHIFLRYIRPSVLIKRIVVLSLLFDSIIFVILIQFSSIAYLSINRFLNSKFISVIETTKSMSSSSFLVFASESKVFVNDNRNKTFYMICSLFDLWRIIKSNCWMYSKILISRKFSLFVEKIVKDIYFAMIKKVLWSVYMINETLIDFIICRIFRSTQTSSVISNSMNQYLIFAENKSRLKNKIDWIDFRDK